MAYFRKLTCLSPTPAICSFPFPRSIQPTSPSPPLFWQNSEVFLRQGLIRISVSSSPIFQRPLPLPPFPLPPSPASLRAILFLSTFYTSVRLGLSPVGRSVCRSAVQQKKGFFAQKSQELREGLLPFSRLFRQIGIRQCFYKHTSLPKNFVTKSVLCISSRRTFEPLTVSYLLYWHAKKESLEKGP